LGLGPKSHTVNSLDRSGNVAANDHGGRARRHRLGEKPEPREAMTYPHFGHDSDGGASRGDK